MLNAPSEPPKPGDRPKVYRIVKTTKRVRQHLRLVIARAPDDPDRPTKRGDCKDGPRPCPYVSCRHHLYLDVNPKSGSVKVAHPYLEPEDLVDSCSLDVADEGGASQVRIGKRMNLTRQRVEQIIDEAGRKIAGRLSAYKPEGHG